jgi:hypothetical protein
MKGTNRATPQMNLKKNVRHSKTDASPARITKGTNNTLVAFPKTEKKENEFNKKPKRHIRSSFLLFIVSA